MDQTEEVGEKFNLKKLLRAREKSILAVHDVASQVFEGMAEKDGIELIDKVLKKHGTDRKWHPNKFRIGKNTVKPFREKSQEEVILQKNDIFFIDIGPIFDDHEGDFGKTFVFGESSEYERVIKACEYVFQKTAMAYKSSGLTGAELYDHAAEVTNELGYSLNLKMSGHRLGDFPHSLYFKGKLGDVAIAPKENLWVLEILIRHPQKDYGAFYEDLI